MSTYLEFEQQAREELLPALADQLAESGIDKKLADYTKIEVMDLVNTLLDAYHISLQDRYDREIG